MTPSSRDVRPAFMRLDERNGWSLSSISTDVTADKALGAVRLGSPLNRPVPFTELGGTFGGLTRPTGLAVGPDGWLVLADPGSNRLLGYSPATQAFAPLWESEPEGEGEKPNAYSLKSPRGVCFSPEGDLVVADSGHARLVIYTWPRLQPRRIVELPGGEPWDVDFDSRGRLYVADGGAGIVRRFSPQFWQDSTYLGGRGTLRRPRHLAIDKDDSVFVLDEGLGEIVRLDSLGRPIGRPLDNETLVDFAFPLPLRLTGGTLELPQDGRPDCPALELTGIEVDRSGRLVDVGAMLLARPRGAHYPRNGSFYTESLDSDIINCAWHRVVLDASIPDLTSITVRSFTAGGDMEPSRIHSLPLSVWSTPITIVPEAVPEVLIQSPPGRYLWLRIDLTGNGESTPEVRALTLFSPRYSSLNYLPPIYQDDPVSASFLDRLLSYFDTVFAEIETQVEAFAGHLDPDSTPAEFLAWLGSWFDLSFLAEWSPEKRRVFISRAIELYKRRGTPGGLQEFLQLHTGLESPQPSIIEHFRLRDYKHRREMAADDMPHGGPSIAGFPLDLTLNSLAHRFTVVLPAAVAADEQTLRQLIEVQKPAHTAYDLRLVKPGIRIGCQSTIGVDTLVGDYPQEPLGTLILGQSGRLASPDEARPKLGQTRLVSG